MDHDNSLDLLCNIYVQEDMPDRLLKALKNEPTLDMLGSFAQNVVKVYPNEIYDLFRSTVLRIASGAMHRYEYVKVCQYLSILKEIGTETQAMELVNRFKNEYSRKHAFLRELKLV